MLAPASVIGFSSPLNSSQKRDAQTALQATLLKLSQQGAFPLSVLHAI
jgi:hypothetical protein